MLDTSAWAEEEAETEVLKDQISKYEDLGKRLRVLQVRFSEDSTEANATRNPVRVDTREHQIVADNIDKLSRYIDRMLTSGQDKANEERIIKAGPQRAGLDEYLAAMKRIDRALERMTSANMRAQQQTIGDYNELLGQAVRQVQELYQRALVESTPNALEPLHYITKQLPFPSFNGEQTAQLGALERALATPNARSLSYNQRENVAVRLYSEVRAPYLVASLQSLSLASISTSKRKDADEPYRPGTSAIGTYGTALEGLVHAEFRNISSIFAQDDWAVVLEITCRKALAELAKTLRELNAQIKANMGTDCFLAYEIIDVITNIARKIAQITHDIKLPFADALKPVRETAKQTVPGLLEDQYRRINALQTLPADGAVLPLTAETMTRLQMMQIYAKPLSSILASLGDGNWGGASSSRAPDVGADGAALLSHYVLDTIEAHLSALDGRARVLLKSKAVAGVFLYNSLALIDRMIRSSDLASLLADSAQAQHKMENWRKKVTATYMDSWKEPCSALLDVVYTNRSSNRPTSGAAPSSNEIIKNLNSKDKDTIKEKFKAFNSSFEDCVRRHKDMTTVMEREVKNGLAREITNMIEPLYTRFFDKYEAIDRGRGKYVRYDKGTLAATLAGLA